MRLFWLTLNPRIISCELSEKSNHMPRRAHTRPSQRVLRMSHDVESSHYIARQWVKEEKRWRRRDEKIHFYLSMSSTRLFNTLNFTCQVGFTIFLSYRTSRRSSARSERRKSFRLFWFIEARQSYVLLISFCIFLSSRESSEKPKKQSLKAILTRYFGAPSGLATFELDLLCVKCFVVIV